MLNEEENKMGTTSISSASKITSDYIAPQVSNKSQALGKDDFLTLLLAQMKYQDPLNPADNTESIAQMAQFSSLEKMDNLNTTLASFGSYQKSLNSLNGAQFIGKDIDFSELQTVESKDAKTGNITESEVVVVVSGKVSSISYTDGEPSFVVTDSDGKTHNTTFDSIKNVKDTAATSYTTNSKLNSVISGAAMVGRDVTGSYEEMDSYGKATGITINVAGTVRSVSFSGETPTLKIVDSDGEEHTMKMEDVLSVV